METTKSKGAGAPKVVEAGTPTLTFVILLPAALLAILLWACSDGNEDNGSSNNPPGAFALTMTTNGATGVELMPTFSWQPAADPDGDAVTYDLYIDTQNPPVALVEAGITAASHTLTDRLSLNTAYHWKVVAKDAHGAKTESNSAFVFTTRGLTWTEAASAAGFSARQAHTSAVFDPEASGQAKLWVIGGFDGTHKNDVWHSSDGISWTEASPAADFPARGSHTSVVFDNKLWVIGGNDDDGGLKNDAWRSSDGISWTQATPAADFPARSSHTSMVFDNKMWVIGGFDGGPKNDVWHSIDGINWTQATAAAAFSARYGHTSTVFDGKLWVIGGYGGSSKNDVWYSSDGITWTEATPAADFPARSGHTSVVFDPDTSGQDKLWVIGGYDDGGSEKNDVWYSSDGATWLQATGFSGRSLHTSEVFDGKLWVIGGYANNGGNKKDVWFMN